MLESWNPVGLSVGLRRSRNWALFFAAVGALVLRTPAPAQVFNVTVSPNPVCVGGVITVTVTDDCAGDYAYNSETGTAFLNIDYDGPDMGWLPCTAVTNGVYYYTGTYTTTNTDGGSNLVWEFSSSCYGDYWTTPDPVVAVGTVTFSPTNADNWTGNTITFSATTLPEGVTCPCTITWTGPGVGGSNGASVQTSYTNTGVQKATAWVGISSNTASLTIHQLVATCVDPLPVPQVGRTNLGLGESVILTVNPPTTGTNLWLLLSTGHGSLVRQRDGSRLLTVGQSPSTVDGVVGVTCQMAGINSPQATYGPINILAPTSLVYLSYITNWDLYQVMRAGTNLIGLRGYFQAQYGPLTVSFTNAQLRENPPLQIINFPSGKDPFVVHQGPYTPVPPSDSDFYDNPLLNAALDMIGLFPPNPITDLLDKNTQVMTPFSATITVPLQYQDANGNWQTFYSHTTSINISTSGVTTISVGAPGPVISSPPTNSGPWTNYGH